MKTEPSCCDKKAKIDYLFWVCLVLILVNYTIAWQFTSPHAFSTHVFTMMNQVWWGILIGLIMLVFLSLIPKALIIRIFGDRDDMKSLFRAAFAGVLLDLCSHGILMIAAKLYERGVSIGQIMAFLIASPWNSFSLTLILIALVGIKWTISLIVISMIIGVITGRIFQYLVKQQILPDNPNRMPSVQNKSFIVLAAEHYRAADFKAMSMKNILLSTSHEAKMVLRWLLLGVLLTALIKTVVPTDLLKAYFGPGLLGLGATLLAATIIEVCSEGSTPIASDLFTRAQAPGNGMAFLMAGVSTDYTEIMILKDTTRSWKIALFLPLVTLPQIIVWAIILNSIYA